MFQAELCPTQRRGLAEGFMAALLQVLGGLVAALREKTSHSAPPVLLAYRDGVEVHLSSQPDSWVFINGETLAELCHVCCVSVCFNLFPGFMILFAFHILNAFSFEVGGKEILERWV